MIQYLKKEIKCFLYLNSENEGTKMDEKAQREAADARNAYARKWRAANKEKVRANNQRYWLRKAEREKAIGKAEQGVERDG